MKLLLIIPILFLSGCSLFNTDPLIVSNVPVEKVPLILPEVDHFQYREISWMVVTEENYEETVSKLKSKGSMVLFAITAKGYENLSLNTSDILKLIKQQREIIIAYEKYYNTLPTELLTDEVTLEAGAGIPEIE